MSDRIPAGVLNVTIDLSHAEAEAILDMLHVCRKVWHELPTADAFASIEAKMEAAVREVTEP